MLRNYQPRFSNMKTTQNNPLQITGTTSLPNNIPNKVRNKNYTALYRSFHATAKREILPLLGVAAIAVVGRYSYKAMQRMDEEWEDYEHDLAAYNSQNGIQTDLSSTVGSSSSGSRPYGGIMGFDLGTSNLRVSHAKFGSGNTPNAVENREGGRFTPTPIILNEDDDDDDVVLGNLAKRKLYERTSQPNLPQVLNPQSLLLDGDERASTALDIVIRSVANNALDQVLSGTNTKDKKKGQAMFGPSFYNVQPVFTYPISLLYTEEAIDNFKSMVEKMTEEPYEAQFVAEPIAAVEAAKKFDLLPKDKANGHILVIDVGASNIDMSLLQDHQDEEPEVMFHSTCANMGGDALQTALVNILLRDFYGPEMTVSTLSDGMALQRLYDAAEGAVMELSSKSRSEIKIPFLSMDIATKQPKHLETGVGRAVLSDELNSFLLQQQQTTEKKDQEEEEVLLSKSLPPPKTMSALISSMTMKAMEDTNQNPFGLWSVLLVGGGARSPIFQNAVKEGLAGIAGEQFVTERLVIPSDERVEELVVLGAAIVGEKGL